MNRTLHFLAHVLCGLGAMAGFGALFMLLWNALMPSIFGIASIGYWQALGLLVLLAGLSKFMLLSAFLGIKGYRHNPVREKWQKMTPEEREEFIRRHRHCAHGFRGFDSEKKDERDASQQG
ncbi:MAG: hypothetical protein LBD89_03150 [Tannerellaceae bacterium]|jgi:hypothetical protein|nr:hypothetical protein [Tannerellaceae bacterium]